jgi:hypothetical protein
MNGPMATSALSPFLSQLRTLVGAARRSHLCQEATYAPQRTAQGERLVGADIEGVRPIARKTCEDCIDLTTVAGVEDLDLQAHGAGGGFDASYCGLAGLAGLTRTAIRVAVGTSSRRSSRRFAANSSAKKLNRQVSAWPGATLTPPL